MRTIIQLTRMLTTGETQYRKMRIEYTEERSKCTNHYKRQCNYKLQLKHYSTPSPDEDQPAVEKN